MNCIYLRINNAILKTIIINCTNDFIYLFIVGKTYTIVGTAEEPGIIPRALEYVFRSLPSLSDEPNIKLKSDGIIVRRGEASFPRNDKSIRDHLLKSVSSFSDFNQHIRTYRYLINFNIFFIGFFIFS